ncbi:MAG TPA: aspartyl/asparaginyl beta-hydroxylase domain-containing protein [Bryobacteraceae bacterium]|jgi:mannose-6-phosphate isomerase-like protein (cupin superfamily)|nr:aspartyl/asparaginyl beta-hydroxylase domain-containing protein [Bryobacteraceae bacterium]
MHVGLALPFRFDPERLKADLALIRPEEWTPHYNQNDFGGDWRGVALRSPTGQITNLLAPFTSASTFADTPLMTRCAYFRETVSAFPCPLKAVRLLSLAPGSFIREHTDSALVYEDGEMRIHIPVQTSAEVEFYVAGERLKLEEGHSYYVNVNLPHRITNRGEAERIHLIIDVEVNDWVHELVRSARAQQSAIQRTPPRARNFDDFAALVRHDSELRETLRSISDPSEFLETTVRLGCERGFDLIQADVEAALHVNVENGAPVRRMPRCEPGHSKLGWTPIEIHCRQAGNYVEWVHMGTRRFTEPFFEQTIRACLENPFTTAFRQQSRLEGMDEAEFAAHSITPSGFIFHMSRCGSTLAAQMLASLSSTVVVSEPPLLDKILQAHLRIDGLCFEEQAAWLRHIVLALGQRRTGAETHYFVKLDAWHIHRVPLLRAAFPEAPCLFLFRDPEQVMISHLLSPAQHTLRGGMPDPRVLRLSTEDITRLDQEEWCANVLACICESALAYREDPQMLFVNYSDLPDAVYGSIARHFSLPLDEADLAKMRERACFEARTGSPWPASEMHTLDSGRAAAVRELCAGPLAVMFAELQQAARR